MSYQENNQKIKLSDVILNVSLFASCVLLLSVNIILIDLKAEIDESWNLFDLSTVETKHISQRISDELKQFTFKKLEKRQNYDVSLQLPLTEAVEASPPSIKPLNKNSMDESNICSAGQPGIKGRAGDRGLMGEDGKPGNPGFNADNVVVEHILSPCLYCPAGEPGEPGARGAPGARGLRGSEGVRGVPGYNGYPGAPGEPGNVGSFGKTGPVGLRGRRGFDSQQRRGLPGPMGPTGTKGEVGIEGDIGRVGPKGSLGLAGMNGSDGDVGKIGQPGRHGNPGYEGKRGLDGLYCPCPELAVHVEA